MPRRLPIGSLTDFGRFLENHGIRAATAAASLGISRSFVYELSTVEGTPPSLDLAIQIRKWSEVIDPRAPVLEGSWEVFFRRS